MNAPALAPEWQVLFRYAAAVGLGLLMGLERERNPSALGGVRTFALTALFSVMSAQLAQALGSPWIVVAGLLLTGGYMIAAYQRQEPPAEDPGTTTVAALLVCYGLGVLCWLEQFQLAAVLGVSATMLLYFKTELRGFSHTLTRQDLLAILQFAVLSLVVLPLLPNRDYGPYGALNPYQIWWLVVLVAGISLAGYAALRIVGQKHGVWLLGVLGGVVSSTGTTLIFARHARRDAALAPGAAIIIVTASLMSAVRLIVLAAILAPVTLAKVLPVLATGLLPGLGIAAYGYLKLRPARPEAPLALKNPMELRAALGFGALYALVLLASAWITDLAGPQGFYPVAFASGLTDIDAITLSSLRLYNLASLDARQAAWALALAMIANLALKSGLTLAVAGLRNGRHAAAGMGMLGAGILAGAALFLR